MIAFELFFKQFHSRGSGSYLDRWAGEVDAMAADGWRVLDCCRDWRHPGYWTAILGRPEGEFSGQRTQHDLRENCGD
jgi:hypothetical protein